jgi:DNA-directed RNA polymerase beta' subunit
MTSQKEQFHEKGEIYRPESMIFGVPEPQLLGQYSVVQVNNFVPYIRPDTREPSQYGVFDPKLGVFNRDQGDCPTCGKPNLDCPGHFGHIDLVRVKILSHVRVSIFDTP